jgi:hypothetical protein
MEVGGNQYTVSDIIFNRHIPLPVVDAAEATTALSYKVVSADATSYRSR